MSNMNSIQDDNQVWALTAHSGTAGTAETVRVVATSAGALSVDLVSGETITVEVGTISAGTIDVLKLGTVVAPDYLTYLDETTTASCTYVGKAPVGSGTASAVWQIKKIDETGSGTTLITFAGTTTAFNQVWGSRSSLGYG